MFNCSRTMMEFSDIKPPCPLDMAGTYAPTMFGGVTMMNSSSYCPKYRQPRDGKCVKSRGYPNLFKNKHNEMCCYKSAELHPRRKYSMRGLLAKDSGLTAKESKYVANRLTRDELIKFVEKRYNTTVINADDHKLTKDKLRKMLRKSRN